VAIQYKPDEMNVKHTFRKVAVMTARLLGNLGVSPPTSLLSHFSSPMKENERCWLDALYLDTPEEWDDPIASSVGEMRTEFRRKDATCQKSACYF
jgi:hypothetical protein